MANSNELEELLNRGYRYALSLTNNNDDAFDLVQNAYVKIVEKGKPLIISYLIITIKNQFIDTTRKEKLRFKWFKTASKNNIYHPNFTVEPYLEKILAQLPVKTREIIFLAIVEEYTAQEIADLLNISRGTILSILSRTKQKLRLKLKEKKEMI
jgi:RNA polymerase sigma-70 factor, ECF subfamily